MMLTRSRLTPASRADLTTFRPSAVRPSGSTGRVREIRRFGLDFWRAARACERRATEAPSATAAPSMSRSMKFSLYASTTALYSAVSALTSVHAWASSIPVAPPKDTFTSPPCPRIASIWSLNCPLRGSNALNQLALHPAEVTNASEYDLIPLLAASAWRLPPLDSTPMSTYGATSTPLGPGAGWLGGGELGLPVGEGLPVGDGMPVGDGWLVAVGLGFGLPPPPVHAAPLILQPVGVALPVTMKPKLVEAPAATFAL